MTYWQYLKTTQGSELKGITEELAQRLATLIGRGHSVADLLAHYGDDFGHIPAAKLQGLARARRAWQIWRKRKQQLDAARKEAKLPALPPGIGAHAPAPHSLDATLRAARVCPRDAVASDEAWLEALKTGAELWDACVGVARKEGTLTCDAKDLRSAGAAHFADYVREREPIADIAPHRWLAMRRGVREGVLTMSFELPREAMLEQLALRKANLGPQATEREDASLLDELVLDDLPAWLTTILDQEAEAAAIGAASESLLGLLRSTPLQARRVAALFIGRAKSPVGVVVADREGEVLAQRAIKPEGAYLPKITELITEYNVHHVVVPSNAPGAEVLTEIQQHLAGKELQLTPIRPAAMAEARRPLTDPPMRLGQSVASALVLARRALDPVKEWAQVDPVGIGVAEYQNDLNEERLRAALRETVELSRLERRRGTKGSGHHGSGAAATRGLASMARLNPLVKTINDLRPGMTLHGVVTNISHFGAFINVGLAQEALVHISELSDRFVSNPNEVVSIGQQISAHVLAVDPPRGRISLSMKTQGARPQRRTPQHGMAAGRHNPLDALQRPGRRSTPAGGLPSEAPPSRSRTPTPPRSPAPPRSASNGNGNGNGGAPPRGGDGSQRQPPKNRAQALADLERLFKK